MTDVEKIRDALSWAANWLGMKFTPRHQEATDALDRIAARVEEGWQPITDNDVGIHTCLLTNNLNARDAFGYMSHVWMGRPLLASDPDKTGRYIMFDASYRVIHGLTHFCLVPPPPETNDEPQ